MTVMTWGHINLISSFFILLLFLILAEGVMEILLCSYLVYHKSQLTHSQNLSCWLCNILASFYPADVNFFLIHLGSNCQMQ